MSAEQQFRVFDHRQIIFCICAIAALETLFEDDRHCPRTDHSPPPPPSPDRGWWVKHLCVSLCFHCVFALCATQPCPGLCPVSAVPLPCICHRHHHQPNLNSYCPILWKIGNKFQFSLVLCCTVCALPPIIHPSPQYSQSVTLSLFTSSRAEWMTEPRVRSAKFLQVSQKISDKSAIAAVNLGYGIRHVKCRCRYYELFKTTSPSPRFCLKTCQW